MIEAVVITLGVLLRFLAIWQNPGFSGDLKIPVKLCDWGVYRYVRHPGYTGSFLMAFGLAALAFNVQGVMVTLLLTHLILTHRADIEEQMLSSVFPEYPAYMQRTGRFLPRWRF